MKRILVLSILALAVFGGVASADRGRHRGHWKHKNSGWSAGVVVRAAPVRVAPRRVYVERVRKPIYMQRPVIRYRYYNYDQRPRVIAENYNAMPGYTWVAGQWSWNGGEWIWVSGHYQPDQQYDAYPQ